MPEPENEVMDCPHCNASFYPHWNNTTISAIGPDRLKPLFVGSIKVTTCTSAVCNKVIILLEDQEGDKKQLLPVSPEVVIEIIIQVFIDFEHMRREQTKEEKMTADEEDSFRTHMGTFFHAIYEAVHNNGSAVQVAGKYVAFFNQLAGLLTSP